MIQIPDLESVHTRGDHLTTTSMHLHQRPAQTKTMPQSESQAHSALVGPCRSVDDLARWRGFLPIPLSPIIAFGPLAKACNYLKALLTNLASSNFITPASPIYHRGREPMLG